MAAHEFLLDTNVAIGHIDGQQQALGVLAQHAATLANTAISQISRIELLSYPAITPFQQRRIADWLATVAVIPLDEAIERESIAIRRRTRLDLADAIIAATAVVYGLTLITFDDDLAAVVAGT